MLKSRIFAALSEFSPTLPASQSKQASTFFMYMALTAPCLSRCYRRTTTGAPTGMVAISPAAPGSGSKSWRP
jgi:hypothetical protein